MEPQLGLYVRLGEILGLRFPTIGIRARLGPVVVWMVFPRLDPGRRYEKGGIVAIVEGEAHGALGLRGGLLGVQTQSHIGKIIISKLTYKLGGLLLLSPIGFRMEPQLGLYVRLGEILGLRFPTIGIRARLGPVEAGKKAGCSDGKGRRYEKGGIVAIVEGEAHGALGLRGGLLGVQTQSHIGKIIISKLTYKLGGLLLLSPIGFKMEPQLGLYVRLGEILGLRFPTIDIRARLGPVVVWMVFPRLDPGRRYEKGGIVAIVEGEAHGALGLRGGLLGVQTQSHIGQDIVVICRQEVALENRIHILSDEGDIVFQRIQESEQCDPKEDQRIIIIQPLDDWLPITQSRKGNSWTAMFHLLCSGIGVQTLFLPLAFVYLGWFWGITCLSVAFMWQFYTIGLLVSLHESVPGTRYSRYLHLLMAAFGPKLGKVLAIFPVMYLSGGTCVMFIITGGGTMKLFYQLVCEDCSSKHPLSTTQWFLVFTCLAIIVSMLCPDMHSVSLISFLGAIMVVGYCTILWIFFVAKGRVADTVYNPSEAVSSEAGRIRSILNALGIIALVFRGHNVVLEIQGTMPSTPIRPSSQLMWKGVIPSYVIISLCFFPLAIVGYWSFGNKIPIDGGLLTALSTTLNNHTSKPLISLIYIQVSITSKLMGHKRSPQPYLYFLKTGLNTKMFRGINFASGASGLLDVTGKDLNIVSMSAQIKQFESVCSIMAYLKGRDVAKNVLEKSMIAISIGSNDIFGYFESRRARKFGIISVAPIGCCPSQRIHNTTGGCLEIENTFAHAFYSSLDALLKKLTYKLSGMKYALGNSYEMTINVINHPQLFNFTTVDTACCGEGWLNGEKICTSKANLCSNRNKYLFWDLYHPTQYASELAATTLYNGGQQFVTPINFAQLAAT
ncbi:lysine histidine transporter-like 8 protein [Tanacetum coccineum]